MEKERRPLLAITMGDPAGIGPEILLKSLKKGDVYEKCRPLVVGDIKFLKRASEWVGAYDLNYDVVENPREGLYRLGSITILNLSNADPDHCKPGEVSAMAGRAAAEYVIKACNLALDGQVDAIVTAPINKEALRKGGVNYPGHTEILKDCTGADKVGMLLMSEKLRIIHISTHVSLKEAIQKVTTERIEEVIELAQETCLALGIDSPKIAVAGLNPHASEGGLFGDEEHKEIAPAIEATRNRGFNVYGPKPPDTVFLKATKGLYDIVIAMYHDQGHIPIKLLAFDKGVNVTIGLPIIRTSVDHGTAFDIAGTGKAREDSLIEAIDIALKMINTKEG